MLWNLSTFRVQCNCWDELSDSWFIYHNPKLWLISLSSNWFQRITISDKNLWATQVRYPWDSLTQENVWGMYQWWNCYKRPSLQSIPSSKLTREKINASWYWPLKPRYYDMFIWNTPWNSNHWDSSDNLNIWWWWWDEEYYMFDNWNNRKLRQFMCDDWFHIPSWWELIKLLYEIVRIDNLLNDSWIEIVREDDYTPVATKKIYVLNKTLDWWKYILAPNAWGIDAKWWVYKQWWLSLSSSSSINQLTNWHYNDAIRLMMGWSYNWIYTVFKTSWTCIRPFKDEPVTPDDSWIKLY